MSKKKNREIQRIQRINVRFPSIVLSNFKSPYVAVIVLFSRDSCSSLVYYVTKIRLEQTDELFRLRACIMFYYAYTAAAYTCCTHVRVITLIKIGYFGTE